LPLSWLDRDGKLIFLSRTVRAFGYGFLSISLGIYLSRVGFNDVQIGFLLMAAVANSIFFNLLAGVYADRWGRRRTLGVFAVMMALSGLAFFLTASYPILIVAAFLGTINVTGTESSSFLSVEQAMVPQTVPIEKRNTAFGLYNAFSGLALAAGALVGGIPHLLSASYGFNETEVIRSLFLVYSLVGLAMAAIYSRMTNRVEVGEPLTPRPSTSLSPESKRVIARLSALFGVDAFAGGFVVQSIFALWFSVKFGIDLTSISFIFAATALLQAFSFLVASRLADRFGLINTMVFTHLPSSVFLVLIPLAPTLPLAVATLLARSALSQMDVPTRQSYLVAVVKPEERTTATGLTTLARNVTQSISPSITGYLLQVASLSAPFYLAGGLKIIYDFGLYTSFRQLKPADELTRDEAVKTSDSHL
jgi:MFS family permease